MRFSFSVFIRYPLTEIAASALAVLVAALLPWKIATQRGSVVFYTSLSVLVALVWYFAVRYTPKCLRWIHVVVGLGLLAAEFFYFGSNLSARHDIFLVPLGLGILIAYGCDLVRRVVTR